MQIRENALREWLADTMGHQEFQLFSLTGDASFRRYFRVTYNGLTQIVMDAPPEKESTALFIKVHRVLLEKSVRVPQILAVNENSGFILLEDFGDDLLLSLLNTENVGTHYHAAIRVINQIQTPAEGDKDLPEFNIAFMLEEMDLFKTWFLNRYLSLHLTQQENEMIAHTLSWLAKEVYQQPQVMIHRDFHSRNLMLTEQGLGVIDFQDAMSGPVSYDLVSLLKDCYIAWPREKVLNWVDRFHSHSPAAQSLSRDAFVRAFDLCGLQRHLKVLGIFSRLFLRDDKSSFLKDLPLTLEYVLACCEMYEELHPLFHFIKTRISLP